MSVLIRVFVQVCVSLVAVSKGVFLAVVFLAVMFEGFFLRACLRVFSLYRCVTCWSV